MKITYVIKACLVISFVLIFSFPVIACDVSSTVNNGYADTDSLSSETLARVRSQLNEE